MQSETQSISACSKTYPTYFIRHTKKLAIDDMTRERLWQDRRIAIHYPNPAGGPFLEEDSTSLSLDDYRGAGRSALKSMCNLGESGGYVYAEHFPRKSVLVGFVEPHSQIELWSGKWSETTERRGRTAILKTLRLTRVAELEPIRIVALSVGRPRQGTIKQWSKVKGRVRAIVEQLTIQPSLDELTPPLQEVLCSEFLRSRHAAHPALPVLVHLLQLGRTLRDIDIHGLAEDGKQILAQVTHNEVEHAEVRAKIEKLRPYQSEHSHTILFCSCRESAVCDGIQIVSLEDVFETVTATECGMRWFSIFLGNIA